MLNEINPRIIQHEPIPQIAYEHAQRYLVGRGFSVVKDLPLTGQLASLTLDALAFAHPVRRTATDASFTLFNATNSLSDSELIPLLAQSAAPFHLIHRHNRFSFWLSKATPNGQIEPIQVNESDASIEYDQLDNALSKYDIDLQPQAIINFKQHRTKFAVFQELNSLQLLLFAENATGKWLQQHFAYAVNVLRDPAYHLKDSTVAKLAIQILGLLVLADTGLLGDEARRSANTLSAHQLIEFAQGRSFRRYFDKNLFGTYARAVEEAHKVLRRLSYPNFEPAQIVDLSKTAYSEDQRKEYGLFDTPLNLTRRIWENIPIEFLRPEERIVADMTCGWGSFLISAYERYSSLSDMQRMPLTSYLHGNDIYGPTHLWAGLALLLSTSQDHWDIGNEDAFAWKWLRRNRPNIIVGNPPFEGNRKDPAASDKQRQEKANRFLDYAIDRLADGGYLAMVMPRSFVAAQASPELRRKLLSQCDVHELWEVPDVAFPEGTVRTLVLFAQKQKTKPPKSVPLPVRVRTVQRASFDQFCTSGVFTASGLATDQRQWDESSNRSTKSRRVKNNYVMEYRIILSEAKWRELRQRCINLEDIATVFQGAELGRCSAPIRNPRTVKWLSDARAALKSDFRIEYPFPVQTKKYPNDFIWPRRSREALLEGEKVLLTSNHDPSWGKRVRVAIERGTYFVSDSFWVLVPKPKFLKQGITNEVIAAVLNWKVSNAWIVEHMRHPKLPGYAIKTVLFPVLDASDCVRLTNIVLELEQATAQNDDRTVKSCKGVIDTILRAAYKLDIDTYRRLSLVYEWDLDPHITLDAYAEIESDWPVSGVVEELDLEKGKLTIWTDEFNDLQTIPIHPSMPGWLLRPKAAFHSTIKYELAKQGRLDVEHVAWGRFQPQPYTYLGGHELLSAIFETIGTSGGGRE